MSLRSRLLAIFLFLVVPVALTPYRTMAQQPARSAAPSSGVTTSGATVHGLVVDPDDALIPGATVTLTPASGRRRAPCRRAMGRTASAAWRRGLIR